MNHNKIQSRLFIKARFAGFLLQFTPFIRMIGLNGSLPRQQANESSDIDFLIISKKNRIWVCRAMSVLIMALFGLKRYENKISGRVCLNLYQTENHLVLSTHNKTLARNYAYTLPLWQTHSIFMRFITDNAWIKKFGEDFLFNEHKPALWEKAISTLILTVRIMSEFLFDLFLNDWGEKILKNYQIQRIMKDERTLNSRVGDIFLSDKELRFHLRKY